MSADTLTADGAPVTLTPPADQSFGAYQSYSSFSYGLVSGVNEIVTASSAYGNAGTIIVLTGYDLDGSRTFQFELTGGNPYLSATAGIVPFGTDTQQFAVAWTQGAGGLAPRYTGSEYLAVYDLNGNNLFTTGLFEQGYSGGIAAYGTRDGAHLEWSAQPPGATVSGISQDYYGTQPSPTSFGALYPPFAAAAIGQSDFRITDNQAVLGNQDAVTLPGEPAHAVTDVAAAALADGTKAAVAWVDSGTDYVSIYDSATNSFGGRIGLDWGGAQDVHMVALPDGGFAVSWYNNGGYKGEVFDGAGNGGGVLGLAGDVAGIDSQGDLYTVGLDYQQHVYSVQTYAISGSGGSPGGGGGGGGTTGQTYTSDNNGDVWTGTAGDDTFNLGRGGDWVTGAGGDDTYRFAQVPWAGGHITDFNAGDALDLTGLMSTTSDTGTDGFADGYLKITDDSSGNAQVWADYHIPGNDGWWLVETLDGVSASSLTHAGDVIRVGSSSGGGGGGTPGPTAVSTSDASYSAPSNVNSITLTGSNQTVTANDAQDTTIWSNDTGNTITGGSGDDTIHIGRGGDTVTGGWGKDVYSFGDIPWAAATITNFNPDEGDSIDVSGILARAGYTGSDPVADGYLKITPAEPSRQVQVWANYHLPGNDGWWLVANVNDNTGPIVAGPLTYSNGLIIQTGEHVGGTETVTGPNYSNSGYDTFVMTGADIESAGNGGGDTFIDQGSNNRMFGGPGNDTFDLGTSTTVATDYWGGVNTWVLNPQSTVVTHSLAALGTGDRLDAHALLAASHYTGSDPVGDGYVFIAAAPSPPPGESGGQAASQLMYDPDGTAGPEAARALFDTYTTTPSQFHYADGFFVVQ